MLPRWLRWVLVLGAASAVALSACDDDGGGTTAPATDGVTDAPTGTPDETLEILVTNDDGVRAEGLDALVEALAALPDVEVTVYAPAEDQSGSGSRTTPGPVATREAQTRSGHSAVAVEGTPADSVNAAFEAGVEPDVVVSGVNEGQNLGPIGDEVSGTVGAARTAAGHGVPALAVSQGLGEPPDYATGVEEAVAWVTERRDRLARGREPVELVSINVPTCAVGTVKELVEVPLAAEVTEAAFAPVDCSTGATAATTDVEAFVNGYATLTVLDIR